MPSQLLDAFQMMMLKTQMNIDKGWYDNNGFVIYLSLGKAILLPQLLNFEHNEHVKACCRFYMAELSKLLNKTFITATSALMRATAIHN